VSSNPKPIIIATRGSALALAQANLVLDRCQEAFPETLFEIRIVKTTGDKLQTASLASAGLPKGLFTKEIEEALIRNEADLAVHSLKDLPTGLPAGLMLGAVSPRADVRDVLIYRDLDFLINQVDPSKPVEQTRRGYRPAQNLGGLPHGAVVGTSSPRRSAQVLEHRPDLKIVPIRGNVGTRLKKIAEEGTLDAIILAVAGLERLHLRISVTGKLQGDAVPAGLAATRLSLREMLPCIGQAAIGIEIRENDAHIQSICSKLDDFDTHQSVVAERAFLEGMGGGCLLPVAAHAEANGPELQMRAVSFLGSKPRRGEHRGPISDPVALGKHLAKELGGAI
jgi:hydroxymethylbilane synthase